MPGSYLDPYRQVLEHSGPCFESLLWQSRAHQEVRFRTIAEVGGLAGRVVADLGCGRADMLAWLHGAGIRVARYIGVDALAPMIGCGAEVARALGYKEACFMLADFAVDGRLMGALVRSHGAQALVFSGSLNTMEEPMARAVLGRAWEAIKDVRGGRLVFNFLSDYDGPGPRGYTRRFATDELLAWAKSCTERVLFRHDYLGTRDATIAMLAPR